MLILRIQQKPVLTSEKDAIAPLTALAGALASATPSRRLWARLGRRLVPFDAGTIELLLSAERSFHADPGEVTHLLSLCGTAEGPGEVGVVLVNVCPDALAGAAPGITLSASLTDDVFDAGTAALKALFGRCLDAVAADVAVIGPDAWVRDMGAGWATFTRHVRRDALPAGAVLVPARDGIIVLAHAEAPDSESAEARAAVVRVHEAMQPERTAAHEPKPQLGGPPPALREAPIVASPPPTYLVPAPSPRPAAADLARTAPAPDVPPRPTLPFAEGAPCARPSPPPVDRPVNPRAALSGTSLPLDVPRGPALPFVGSVAGAASPLAGTAPLVDAPRGPTLPFGERCGEAGAAGIHMTLEQYALFRAHLTLRGEEDAETLKAFGVGSVLAKEALQARFVWLFKQDPAAQAAFVELVRKLSTQLRVQPPNP